MAGGDNKDDVLNLALTIGYYNQLSLGRTVKAFDLASASVKAQVTKYRPTARLFKMKEEKEIQEWNTSNCPDRALPGIAYGAIKIANNNSYTRSEKE